MTSLCFITTSRGRLEHLKQSVPRLVAQAGTSCVVVDYDCPQCSGDWVATHFPQVTVVRSGPREHFEAARARNLGAAARAALQADWLAFVDADALLVDGFAASILAMVQPQKYYMAEPRGGSYVGQCIIARADFDRVGGYDSVLQGWGMEDKDLYRRLDLSGCRLERFPSEWVTMLDHHDTMRVEHYALKHRTVSSTINHVYCRAKWDLAGVGYPMQEEEKRRTLYELVTARLLEHGLSDGNPVRIFIPIGETTPFSGAKVSGQLVYVVEPRPAPR